tara:strand:+ start:430 stop:708 length:279 start_codon:yes stop_codon:yes gene_type:complete
MVILVEVEVEQLIHQVEIIMVETAAMVAVERVSISLMGEKLDPSLMLLKDLVELMALVVAVVAVVMVDLESLFVDIKLIIQFHQKQEQLVVS